MEIDEHKNGPTIIKEKNIYMDNEGNVIVESKVPEKINKEELEYPKLISEEPVEGGQPKATVEVTTTIDNEEPHYIHNHTKQMQ